jgi:hypothetical protein
MSDDPLDSLDVAPVEHRRGCPASTHRLNEEGSRLEAFETNVETGRTDERGRPLTRRYRTVRCIECGEQEVEELVGDA